MSKVKDITEEINIENGKGDVTVTLAAHQYKLAKIEQFQPYLMAKRGLLAGETIEVSEEVIVIRYTKETYAQSLEQALKKMDTFHRLVLAQKMCFLMDFLNSPVQPFIHPANVFIFGEELAIAHRGFMSVVVPYTADEEAFLKQYRALILAILHPKIDYELLIEGSGTLKDVFSKKIQEAKSIEEINQLLGEQVVKQTVKRERETSVVSKKKHLIFKWASILLTVLAIGFATSTGIYAISKLPAQERISTAKAQYIANDYAGVLETLKDDQPEDLSSGAKYVAAVSSVELDNLSNKQKTAILNTISPKSNENILRYWIYIGKENFYKALDVAQNLGDNQYILHAYTKLYSATKANNQMNGEEKQELLTKYEEAINEYMEAIEGKSDDDETEEVNSTDE